MYFIIFKMRHFIFDFDFYYFFIFVQNFILFILFIIFVLLLLLLLGYEPIDIPTTLILSPTHNPTNLLIRIL
jgi:hypothetical protein